MGLLMTLMTLALDGPEAGKNASLIAGMEARRRFDEEQAEQRAEAARFFEESDRRNRR